MVLPSAKTDATDEARAKNVTISLFVEEVSVDIEDDSQNEAYIESDIRNVNMEFELP